MDFKLRDLGYHNKHNDKELVWNVIEIDMNSDEVTYTNLLSKNGYIWNEAKDLLKKSKGTISFEEFEKEIDKSLMYMYWSRYEYEHVITTFPPYVSLEGIEQILKERDEKIKMYDRCKFVQVPLMSAIKIDVYTQVQLNWTAFISYLWENREKVYKPRKPKVVE